MTMTMIKMIMMFAICYGFDYDDCDAHGDGDDGQDKTATRTKPHLDHHTQDMNGQNYGLSKEYFQVFLTKASNELGWRPNMDALLALEKAIEEKEDDEPALESDREEELS
eukprot:s418_g2.t1